MPHIAAMLRTFIEADDGVTAMEYALLAGLIAVVIFVAVSNVGGGVSALFSFVAERVGEAAAIAKL